MHAATVRSKAPDVKINQANSTSYQFNMILAEQRERGSFCLV